MIAKNLDLCLHSTYLSDWFWHFGASKLEFWSELWVFRINVQRMKDISKAKGLGLYMCNEYFISFSHNTQVK